MKLEPLPGDYRPPGLVREPIYYAEIPKKFVSKVIDAVKLAIPSGTDNMQHIKRVKPIDSSPDKLSVLLCSQSKIPQIELSDLLEQTLGSSVTIHMSEQSKYPARSKEEAEEWSKQVWPLIWRGNVLAQPPKITASDEDRAIKILHELSKVPRGGECSDVCWILDPHSDSSTNITVGKGIHNDKEIFSRRHAVMQAIDSVAAALASHSGKSSCKEPYDIMRDGSMSEKNSEGYLCLGMDVYCLVEPCVMCCMALVHSRIGRLFFRYDSPHRKGAINYYCLHARMQLNHTFEAWRLIGDD